MFPNRRVKIQTIRSRNQNYAFLATYALTQVRKSSLSYPLLTASNQILNFLPTLLQEIPACHPLYQRMKVLKPIKIRAKSTPLQTSLECFSSVKTQVLQGYIQGGRGRKEKKTHQTFSMIVFFFAFPGESRKISFTSCAVKTRIKLLKYRFRCDGSDQSIYVRK